MPKVISGVEGAKAFATDGTVQNIPETTNRQGARETLSRKIEKVIEAKDAKNKENQSTDDTKANGTGVQADSKISGQNDAPAARVEDDPNEGVSPEDMDLAERARKAIARKHREMLKAQAQLGKLQGELDDTENFSKSQYARAAAAEEQLETLKRELEALKAKAPEAPKTDIPVKPDQANFYDEKGQFKLFEYTEAMGEFKAAEKLREYKAEQDKAQREQKAREQEEAKNKALELAKQRTEEAKKQYSDWDQVVPANPIKVHNLVAAYLTASPHVGHIAYYLAKHPEFAQSLNQMNPLDAVAELGELSIRWKKKPATETAAPIERERPAVPAPVTPLPGAGSTGVTTDPSKMTPAQLLAYDRERAVAKRRRA